MKKSTTNSNNAQIVKLTQVINTIIDDTALPLGKALEFYYGNYAATIHGLKDFLPTFKAFPLSRQISYLLEKGIEKKKAGWTAEPVKKLFAQVINYQEQVEDAEVAERADKYLLALSNVMPSSSRVQVPVAKHQKWSVDLMESSTIAALNGELSAFTGVEEADLDERMLKKLSERGNDEYTRDLADSLRDKLELDETAVGYGFDGDNIVPVVGPEVMD